MNKIQKIYLGSSSYSRQMLLKQAHIPFELVKQTADETKCDWMQPVHEIVKNIALYKMDHVVLPAEKEGLECLVLTADTLSVDCRGKIHGKPIDNKDAIAKIKAVRDGIITTGTAFCLDKKKYINGKWETQERILKYVKATYFFQVPDEWLERYFSYSVANNTAGAISVEEYGNLFLKHVEGSYSAIIGLPLYELREALDALGFYAEIKKIN